MIFKKQEQLDAALAEWQKILRIQDWDVIGVLCRKSAMHEDDANAGITIWRQHKIARIEICEAEDIVNANAECFLPVDHERWLVHELLHLCLDPFVDHEHGTAEHRLYEQFTDSHARILVAMKRR